MQAQKSLAFIKIGFDILKYLLNKKKKKDIFNAFYCFNLFVTLHESNLTGKGGFISSIWKKQLKFFLNECSRELL